MKCRDCGSRCSGARCLTCNRARYRDGDERRVDLDEIEEEQRDEDESEDVMTDGGLNAACSTCGARYHSQKTAWQCCVDFGEMRGMVDLGGDIR